MESQPLMHTQNTRFLRKRYAIGILLLIVIGGLFGMTYYILNPTDSSDFRVSHSEDASSGDGAWMNSSSEENTGNASAEGGGEDSGEMHTNDVVVEDDYRVPCLYGGFDNPPGCVQRFVLCGSLNADEDDEVLDTIGAENNTHCSDFPVRLQQTYIVQFTGSDGRCWEIKAKIGECWGLHPNGSNYGCMGKCGPGCGDYKAGAWARDCFKHDVCSWFFSSSGGRFDDHCGKEFQHASGDYLSNSRCSATNGNDHLVCP